MMKNLFKSLSRGAAGLILSSVRDEVVRNNKVEYQLNNIDGVIYRWMQEPLE